MNKIESPCVRNCCLNEDDVCVGCFRSLTEIMQWGEADDAHKIQILSAAQQRQAIQKST